MSPAVLPRYALDPAMPVLLRPDGAVQVGLAEALRCSGARVARSSQPHAAVAAGAVDLVVLSDYLVADDPRMVRDLHGQGVAHLPVGVRDGTGLVGPLVIPGVISCLGSYKG